MYSEEALGDVLAAEYPDGINLIFEQVGGATFDTCVDHLATRGRILICGFISEYMGGTQEITAPRIYHKLLWKSAQIRAFLYTRTGLIKIADHLERLIGQVANGNYQTAARPNGL